MRDGITFITVLFALFLFGCAGPVRDASSINALPQAIATSNRTSKDVARAGSVDADGCPDRAIFVRRYGEVRAYPLDASDETEPCAIISGSQSNLSEDLPYGNIAISANGFIHALSFQTSDGRVLTIDAPDANGNAVPKRIVSTSQDAVALAVDANVTDYVAAGENFQSNDCWYNVPNGAAIAMSSNCDTNLSAIVALTVDTHGELIVAGPDARTGAARFDFVANPAGPSHAVVRSIEGNENSIPADASLAIAVAPVSGELYVFSRSRGGPAMITEFADRATGNPEPLRTLFGSSASFPQSAFAVNVLAVDDRGFLYVTSVSGTIFVYAPVASGDAVPVRHITDSNAASEPIAAGIALRL